MSRPYTRNDLKPFEPLVKAFASATKQFFEQEKAPVMIPFGFFEAPAEMLGLQKVKAAVPIPWFKKFHPNQPAADFLDTILTMAQREAVGDPQEVWRLFQDYAFHSRRGLHALATGMRVMGEGLRSSYRVYGTPDEKAAARAEYQRVVEELYKQDTTRSYKLLLLLAARKVRNPKGRLVSPLTIKHYVKNPKKK